MLRPKLGLRFLPSIDSVLGWSFALLVLWDIGVDLCSQGFATIFLFTFGFFLLKSRSHDFPDRLKKILWTLGGRCWIIVRHGAGARSSEGTLQARW
jgi:hypothetical protein